MLSSLVDEIMDQMADSVVVGEFHVGLRAVKRFILFYLIVEHEQSRLDREKISILEYKKRVNPLEELPNDEEYNRWWNSYERTLDHFNSLSLDQKVKLYFRQREEAKSKDSLSGDKASSQGKIARFQGNGLYPFQLDEFSVLNNIKSIKDSFSKYSTTYKRLVSEKGYLGKVTFTKYKEFVGLLTDEIEQSQSDYKNILDYKNVRYYKLEKRLGFQATKSVLKALHQLRISEDISLDLAVSDLMMVLQLPLLSERQKYADIYPCLSETDKMRWRLEIDSIQRFITTGCSVLKEYIANIEETSGRDIIQQEDWEEFSQIYMPDTFANDYILRKDFFSEDFLLLMKAADRHNSRVLSDIISHE